MLPAVSGPVAVVASIIRVPVSLSAVELAWYSPSASVEGDNFADKPVFQIRVAVVRESRSFALCAVRILLLEKPHASEPDRHPRATGCRNEDSRYY